ncbi:putative protein ASPARTIC PROTEASE IN GUARD CELL 2 isoform X1 [Iris pallida]|uniref:Peptidase A1 domain-containing protein n=1 Tax=Iris pallida TaxID=29817 RepID=A0AAX6I3F7_IRIPA|nr:putative protein ASPARTIC PROTEASE IN GUARD CELL 2 isoform X1 [Iris pallida]
MLLILFVFFSSSFPFSSSSSPPSYLKLPLLPSLPFPTLQQALAIDSLRLSSSSLSAPIVSAASSGAGQYLVTLRLGSPPQPLRLVLDTGSDLLWVRCSPCRDRCRRRRRRRRRPSFFPRHSSSFSPFHCYHPLCSLLPPLSPSCSRSPLHTPCRYKYSYADRSSSAGLFSRDVLSPGPPGSLSFGCAFNVSAGPEFSSAHGVLGLGRGPISFSSQAGKPYGNAFSYCLPDYTLSPPPTTYLLFGAAAINASLSTARLRSTPLLSSPLSPTFYYVRVLGVSVGGVRLRSVPSSVWALDPATGAGGTIVDSGTTLSFLPERAYTAVVEAMKRRLGEAALAPGPPGFDLCVDSSAGAAAGGIRVPKLSFRLGGGAELSPPARNYFIEAAEGVRCLALQPVGATGAGFGVIGNLMQQGFVLVFDRDGSRLGFAYTGCSA